LAIPFPFDFKNPDYVLAFRWRADRLNRIREQPECLPALKAFYRLNIPQFITDWGCTTDPRNVEIGRPAVLPFLLFPRQVEWVEWVLESWRAQRPGVTPKSRESGVSWLAIATGCALCILNDDVVIGYGSRKTELVDHIGDPDSLFWKAREFMALLPPEFRGSWTRADAPEKRIKFSDTRSVMKGEGGDDIGRGGRSSIYFLDEAAFLAHPELAEASLSQTTNCRIDVSTANGIGNPFHRKVVTWPTERVFPFHWRDDPRKDDAWYAKKVDELDPVTIAQELDIDFAASVDGVLIPSAWVQASIDAHVKLGFKPTGARTGALDVADEGKDQNAFCGAHGPVIEIVEEWSGKGNDIFGTVQRAFGICDEAGYSGFKFDSDGLGAGVRGDARVINEQRDKYGRLTIVPFRGSSSPFNPEREDVKGRKNQDFFANCKAQAWWSIRVRFQKTFRAVMEGAQFSPDELISIPSSLSNRQKLCAELSQPTYSVNGVGKIVINKAPDGTKSPNLADSVMIRYSSAIDNDAPFVLPHHRRQQLVAAGRNRMGMVRA
jgi:phage terminase large subunit